MSIVTREQLEHALNDLRALVDDPREGILGPRSIVWRVGGDLGLFLGGGRAALLQLAHPFVAYAIADHSHTRTDIVGRFQRTFHNVFAMIFGDLDDALRAARRVHAVHSRIHGTLPERVGGWPAGTPYHANDAEALRWVHATLVDTTIVVRERLDGALPVEIKDRYVIEMNRVAMLFGLPRERLPASYAAHELYVDAMLASDRIEVAPCARAMAAFLIGRGGDSQPPLGRIAEAVTASLLPRPLADDFGLRGSLLTDVGLASFGRVHRWLPRRLVSIPARSEALRRLSGKGPSRLGRWTEHQLFGLARRASAT